MSEEVRKNLGDFQRTSGYLIDTFPFSVCPHSFLKQMFTFNEIALLLLLQGSFRGPVSFGSQSFYINNNTFTDAYGGLMLLKFDL
jgi:hypothetical protein